MRHNERVVESRTLTAESDLQPLVAKIVSDAGADGSVITCLAQQNVSGIVKQLSTLVNINVLCK